MNQIVGPLLILIAAAATMAFALRYKREETLRVLGEELGDVMRAELRARTRKTAVRWIGGTFATLGLGLAFGPSALQYTMDAKAKTSTTWYGHIYNGIFTGNTSDGISLGDTLDTPPAATFATDTLQYASEWSTATGSGYNAVKDSTGARGPGGGILPWPTNANNGNNRTFDTDSLWSTVVTVASQTVAGVSEVKTRDLWMPTTNVLRWDCHTAGGGICNFFSNTALDTGSVSGVMDTIPLVGARETRFYFRDVTPDSITDDVHGIGDVAGGAPTNWQWTFGPNVDTNGQNPGTGRFVNVSFQTLAPGADTLYDNFRKYAGSNDISMDSTYRFELKQARIASGEIQFHIEVYNEADELVLDNSDFHDNIGLGDTLRKINADGRSVPYNPTSSKGFIFGVNGQDPPAGQIHPYVYAYGGALCIVQSADSSVDAGAYNASRC